MKRSGAAKKLGGFAIIQSDKSREIIIAKIWTTPLLVLKICSNSKTEKTNITKHLQIFLNIIMVIILKVHFKFYIPTDRWRCRHKMSQRSNWNIWESKALTKLFSNQNWIFNWINTYWKDQTDSSDAKFSKMVFRSERAGGISGLEGSYVWNFIQSAANLVQLFIYVLKHRNKIKFFFFKGPVFKTHKKCKKMQFCDFSKKILNLVCTVVHWGPY